MKILYISSHRRAAEQAASALRPIAPDVAVIWAASLGGAQRWIDENRNVNAFIIELASDDPGCELFVSQIRASGVTVPVIVVTLDDPPPPLATLKTVTEHIVAKDRSFLSDLPHVVARALRTTRPAPRRNLFAEAAAAADRLAPQPPAFTGSPAEAFRERDALARLSGTLTGIEQVRQDRAESGAIAEQLARREAELTRETSHRKTLEQTVADLKLSLKLAEENQAAAVAAAEAKFNEHQTRYDARLAEALAAPVARQDIAESGAIAEQLARREAELTRETSHRKTLEQAVADLKLSLKRAEENQAAAATAAEAKFNEHQTRYDARLSEVLAALEHTKERHASALNDAAARLAESQNRADLRLTAAASDSRALQGQLADTAAALTRMEQQAAAERRTAAEQAAQIQALTEVETELRREVADRQALAKALEEAGAAAARATEQHASDVAAAAAALADHQRHAEAELAAAAIEAETLKTQLLDAIAAAKDADQRAAADRTSATEQAAQRQTEFDTQLAQAVIERQRLAAELNDTQTALGRANDEHASAVAAAAALLADRERQAEARLESASAVERRLKAELVDTARALTDADQRAAADRTTASEQAAQRQAEFDAQLAEEMARRQTLARELADAQAALAREDEQHAGAISDAAARLAELQQRADARAAQAATALDALQAKLAEGAAALQRAEQQAADDRQTAAEEAAQRRAKHHSELTQEVTRRQTLEQQLVAVDEARQHAEQAHATELAAAAARFEDARTQAETRLAQAISDTAAVETQLADRNAVLARTEAQAATDREAATSEAAERRREFDAELAREVGHRQGVERALADEQAARERDEARHASEMAAAAQQLADHQHGAEAHMAQVTADHAAERRAADERAATERQEAAAQAAARQAEFEAELSQVLVSRQNVEAELADARAAAEQTERRFVDQVAEMRQRAHEHEARLEERAVRERAEWEAALADRQERIQHLEMETDLGRQALFASGEQIQRLTNAHAEEQASVERTRQAMETSLARLRTEYAALQVTLDDTRATAQETLDRISMHRATDRATLEAKIDERDTQLRDQAAQHDAAAEAAANTLAGVADHLRLTLAAREDDSRTIADLTTQVASLVADLETTRSQREALQTEADMVPQLLGQIDDIRAEYHRQFQDHPLSLCRCNPDGVITDVNQALASLLGYDTPEELQRVDFAAAVFESAAELPWIVAQRLASGSTESVETTWRRKDRSRIIVRVRVVAGTADAIDLAAEDITAVRALEEQLRNAQRMEAVARYASEVAATCDTLLRDVKQEGQEWLATLASDATRYHGELLLEEVARAAGLLRQLSVYGNDQQHAAELVDVTTVLRDLEPVLKQVAGGNIDLVLPQAATPFNVDVEAERVERILVNVAIYGRGRMRSGGRLMIEVASVMVDRDFIEKYPNVRPGAHVLLTVTEVRGTTPPAGAESDARASSQDKPGVDLGTLQALVSECGGHLWMTVDPPGDMVLKIHLPRRVLDDLDAPEPAKPAARTGWIDRLSGARH